MNPGRAVRTDRLNRLLAMTERFGERFIQAISADFGHRPAQVTRLTDLGVVDSAIRLARRRLGTWMSSRPVPTPLALQPARSRLIPQPLGVIGVVAPWNYPYSLAVSPASAAIAAGNRVMIKPSELTPAFAGLLREAVAAGFAPEEMVVVTGDAQVGREFVALPFDHLIFTGSTAVGRQVAVAAAANLTPVTLELGGKSPAIIDLDCNLARAVRSLVVGKLINAGQTCIAPDYVAVPRALLEDFVAAMRATVQRLYPDLARNPDYTSIVNERHFARLQGLLDDARARGARIVALAPVVEAPAAGPPRMLPPALLLEVTDEMRVMQEEIFGPLLPVMVYDRQEEIIAYVNRHDRPLALYWFGRDRGARERVLRGTHAGGVTLNDCLWHCGQEQLPFGGVGASGMGAYHGEAGFRTFSHFKPVFQQSALSGVSLLNPPYGRVFEFIERMIKFIS
jgi:coniferyl-aldehyde dehydrogenase